jgi:hypothetical protein
MAAVGIAAPYVKRSRAASFEMLQVGQAASDFPGRGNNLVGFAHTPASAPTSFNGVTWPGAWPGAFRNASLGLNTNGCTIAELAAANIAGISSGGIITNGTAGNPTVIAFLDIIGPPNGPGIQARGSAHNQMSVDGTFSGPALNHITFVGCRFQGNDVTGTNVDAINGAANLYWIYCSVTPPLLFSGISPNMFPPTTAPPFAGSWPSASVGTGTIPDGGTQDPAPYQSPYQNCATFAFSLAAYNSGEAFLIDHCDLWGMVVGVNIGNGAGVFPAGSITVTDTWIHDIRSPVPPSWTSAANYHVGDYVAYPGGLIYQCYLANTNQDPLADATNVTNTVGTWWICRSNTGGDHSNGIGFLVGSDFPQKNVTCNHCTIAALGDVAAWSLQMINIPNGEAINWSITNSYLSGFDRQLEFVHTTDPGNMNLTVTDNILATDLAYHNFFLINPVDAMFTQSNGHNNVWRRNKIQLYPGDTWTMPWSMSKAYSFGDYAIDSATYHLYSSAIAGTGSNTNNRPSSTTPTAWTDLGPINSQYLLPNKGLSTTDWAL